MNWLEKIFGKFSWPWENTLADTNPCLDAANKWQAEQAKKDKKVGMVWYCIDGRFDLYHCIGYELVNGEKKYFDTMRNHWTTLKRVELIGAIHIPYNYAAEVVEE